MRPAVAIRGDWMYSAKDCRDQSEKCRRLEASAQSEAEADALRNIAYSWSRLAGQIDRYDALMRKLPQE